MEFLKTTYHRTTNRLVQFVKDNQIRRDHGSSCLILLQQTDTRINQPIKTKNWLMFIILTLVLNSTQVFADNTKSTDELEINSLLQAPISGDSVSLETTPTINKHHKTRHPQTSQNPTPTILFQNFSSCVKVALLKQ